MKGILANMWDNKESVVGGLFDMFDAPKKEAKLGADLDYGLLASNFAPDMKETGEEIKTMVTNPSETVRAIADLGGGAIGKITPDFIKTGLLKAAPDNRITSERTSKMASDAWTDIVATHGSVDGFKKFAQENPFEAMLELTGAGLVARQVKNVTAPVVMDAIQIAEKNGLMDQIRKVGSLPVGLSMKDISKMNPSELKMYMASQDIYNEYLGKVDPNYVLGQPLATQSDAGKLATLKTEIIGQDQDLVTPSGIKLSDLEGRVLMGFESDRTDAGGTLTKVNDFTVNTKLFGGIKFQLLIDMMKREDIWASDKAPLDKIAKQAELVKAIEGEYPLVTQYIMQPQGSNFAHMTQQLMMEVYQQALPIAKKNKINKEIKKLVPEWKGIDADDLPLELSKIKGATRKKINLILGRSEFTNEGLSLAETGLALSDKTLVNAPRGQISGLISEPNFGLNPIEAGSTHYSYPYNMKGGVLGELDRPYNWFNLISHNPINMKGRKYDPNNMQPKDFRAAQTNMPSFVKITDKVLRAVDDQGLL